MIDNKLNANFAIISQYRGVLMGIAILGVLLRHGIVWSESMGSIFDIVTYPFTRIAFTQGFIFLSGFGLFYSFNKNNNLKDFYRKRWYRLMVPFLIMATPFYLYSLLNNGDLISFLLNESTLYFWLYGNNGMRYISISVLLYLLFPLMYVFVFKSDKNKNTVSSRALLLIFISICSVVLISKLFPEYYDMTSIGITQIPIFILGILVGYYALYSCKLTIYHLIGCGILVLTMWVAKKTNNYYIPYYEMSVRLLLIPLTCIIMDKFKPRRLVRFFEWFGKYSLELYVLHMLFVGNINNLLKYYAVSADYIPTSKAILAIKLAIALCSPLHYTIEKVIIKLK